MAAGCVTLVLMHSGREAGIGGLGFTPHSQGGTHVVERNLTRLTVAVATVFGINTSSCSTFSRTRSGRALVAELVDALG